MTFTIGLGGGINNYPNLTGTVPYAWLVSSEGKVVWQGTTGSLSEKTIEEEVRKVKMTPEKRAVRADRALAYAEALLVEKQLARGLAALDKVAREHKGTEAAKKADERKVAVEKDETLKKELDAQKALDRLVGGLELPKDKIKKKEREGKAAQLEGFIKANKESAPVAAEMAAMWVKVMKEEWRLTAK